MLAICTSSRLDVASLRYRLMKGTVAPSSRSLMVFCTCWGRRLSCLAMREGNIGFVIVMVGVRLLSEYYVV